MSGRTRHGRMAGVLLAGTMAATGLLLANGGPFIVKYPNGDPAGKGVLAPLDPDLKPGRETRLRVVKEDLKVTFAKEPIHRGKTTTPPLAYVSAAYTIENPTDTDIEIDFGFPILRGIYMDPFSMRLSPDVRVKVNGEYVPCKIISNSVIYGIIRRRARDAIERGIAARPELSRLIEGVREARGDDRDAARRALAAHLRGAMNMNDRDAALLVEYAGLNLGETNHHPRDRSMLVQAWSRDMGALLSGNLGPLAAIGEQKATQFFAQLASRFDPEATASYEAIFTAWGGDVRERSVDLGTGAVRPREITVEPKMLEGPAILSTMSDPTIYARVDYLDEGVKMSEGERASCRTILKNLPVVFTFAPMNLLHYQAQFPAKATRTVEVTYSQYAFVDTGAPRSYQLAYVVHPASLWREFGPIRLEVAVPEGVPFRASVPCERQGSEERELPRGPWPRPRKDQKLRFDVYGTTLADKTGELFMAIDAEAWGKLQEETSTKVVAERGAP